MLVGATTVYSMHNNVRCFDNLAKLRVPVTKSLLAQGLFGWALYGERCVFF